MSFVTMDIVEEALNRKSNNMDKILEEFEEKFNHIPNRGFIVGKKGGYYDNCAYNIADVSSWLKEKLTAFEKKTKEDFLPYIVDQKGETFFEKMEERKFMLPSGKE